MSSRLKILLIMEQCNPTWTSVPQVAFQIYDQLRKLADVTLVTHARNRDGISSRIEEEEIVYIEESKLVRDYYGVVAKMTSRGNVNWPLQHALGYPVYAEFDRKVKESFSEDVAEGKYDAVMGMTPVLPRYPYSFAGFSDTVPFILGPVNGGLPFPDGFSEVAAKESAGFNFLRRFCSLIPGYNRTYESSDLIFAGSRYTYQWIEENLKVDSERLHLLAENGVTESYFENELKNSPAEKALQLLFVGRLVPYKGGDMLIHSLAKAAEKLDKTPQLRFVGDGPEKSNWESLSRDLKISNNVEFVGPVPPETMPDHFAEADLFCFPSVREFGGAVVLEAMASGVPCIVADHGGIGEYVSDHAGVRIKPKSREYLIDAMADAIVSFDQDREKLKEFGASARECARPYLWKNKAATILEKIEGAVAEKAEGGGVVLSA